jgi:hypothetical protein
MRLRDRALRLFAVRVVFIAIIVEATLLESIVCGYVPFAAEVSPVLPSTFISVGDLGVDVQTAIWGRHCQQIVGSEGMIKSRFPGLNGLFGHNQSRSWGSSEDVRGAGWERLTQNIYLVLAQRMDSNPTPPILVEQGAGWGAANNDLVGRIYVIKSYPWAVLSLEGLSGNVGLPFGLLRQFIGRVGLREGTVRLVLGLHREFVSIQPAFPNFLNCLPGCLGLSFSCSCIGFGSRGILLSGIGIDARDVGLVGADCASKDSDSSENTSKTNQSSIKFKLLVFVFLITLLGFSGLILKIIEASVKNGDSPFVVDYVLIFGLLIVGQVICYLLLRKILG